MIDSQIYQLAATYASTPNMAVSFHDHAADTLLQLNEYDQAAAEIRAALAINKDDQIAHYLLTELPRQ